MKIIALGLTAILLFTVPVSAQIPEQLGTIICDTINTFFGFEIMPVGDVNGDGYTDLFTWDYRWKSFLYFGGPTVDTVPDLIFNGTSVRGNSMGDWNDDNCPEFILTGSTYNGWKTNWYYTGAELDTVRDMWFGLDTLIGRRRVNRGYDLNANGTDEFVVWATGGTSVIGFELGPVWDSVPDFRIFPTTELTAYRFGEGIAVGDFNGDGTKDLVLSFRPDPQYDLNGSVHLYWGGPEFDSIPEMIITRPGTYSEGYDAFGIQLVNLGDFNGDGYDDLLACPAPAYDTVSFLYFGGPDIDTIPDLIFPRRCTKVHAGGDINQDGYMDLLTSYSDPSTGLGDVNFYYGGPDADSLRDLYIINHDMPELQEYFGQDCAAIGDFNGDGRNDFAFSAIGSGGYGRVYIFSGPEKSVDVKYDFEPTFPQSVDLGQNYPNPFNPNTTIEFDLPERTSAKVAVYNILGEKVRTLIDWELSAGSYRLEWDGRNDDGQPVSSGVYFCRLNAGGVSSAKKMMLVR